MHFPTVMAYHPRISVQNVVKGEFYITGNLNDFMLDEDILKSLRASYPKLKLAELVAALQSGKLAIPEGELWLVDGDDVPCHNIL